MIRIVTDTAADITLSQATARGIQLVPLGVHFEEGSYDPLGDETFATFYSMLESSKKLPTTSQPAPEAYLAAFNAAKEAGDDVVALTISSTISGTYQSACIARDMSGYDRVFVVDTLSAVIGQRLLVELAAQKRDEGRTAEQIVVCVQDAVPRVALMAGLDTLRYLRKGGRIPKSMEVLGTMLGVKPMLELANGTIVMAGKARGRMGAMNALLGMIQEKGEPDPAAPVYFGYTGDAAQCRQFMELAIAKFGFADTYLYPIGSVVATHVGPGAFAISYLVKE